MPRSDEPVGIQRETVGRQEENEKKERISPNVKIRKSTRLQFPCFQNEFELESLTNLTDGESAKFTQKRRICKRLLRNERSPQIERSSTPKSQREICGFLRRRNRRILMRFSIFYGEKIRIPQIKKSRRRGFVISLIYL